MLTMTKQAVVSAGTDANICATGSYELISAAVTFGNTPVWSTSGDGVFSDNAAVNPVYTPGVLDIATGSVVLTLTAQSVSPCIPASDDMILTIDLQATAYAGVDSTICQTDAFTVTTAVAINAASILWTSSGTGSFSNDTSLTPTYFPSPNDLDDGSVILTMTLTSQNECSVVSDEMILSFNDQAVVNAGSDDTICEGSFYLISGAQAQFAASVLWETSGDGVFNDATLLNPVYTPGILDIEEGSVELMVTVQSAGLCSEVADAMVLHISHHALAHAGTDAVICEGSSYTLETAVATHATSILWTSTGTGSFSMNSIQNPVYTPSQNDLDDGSVILTMTVVSESPCGGSSDEMLLTIAKPAIVHAGMDAFICETSSYELLDATIENGSTPQWNTSGDGYFSNTASLNPVYTPGYIDIFTGSVVLTLTAQSAVPCSSAENSMLLSISLQATANAGPDVTICENSVYTLIDAQTANATSIAWTSSGTGIFDHTDIQNPMYTPSQNDLDDGFVTLTLTATSEEPCSDVTDQMILEFRKQAILFAGSDDTICESEVYALNDATTNVPVTILWSTSGTGTFSDASLLNPVYTPSVEDIENGIVSLTITQLSPEPCLPASSTMKLWISRTPAAFAGIDASSCQNAPFSLGDALATQAVSILWSSSGTGSFNDSSLQNPEYYPGAEDIDAGYVVLTMTVANNQPCAVATDYMILTLYKESEAFAGSDTAICSGGSYQVSDATALNFASLNWSANPEATGIILDAATLSPTYVSSPGETGVVRLVLAATPNGNGTCPVVYDTMLIQLQPQPFVNAGENAVICSSVSYTLQGVSNTTVLWATTGDGTFSPSANILNAAYTPGPADIAAGLVKLHITTTGAGDCEIVSDTMNLVVWPEALANAGMDDEICNTIPYHVTDASAVNYATVLWTENGTGYLVNEHTLTPTYYPGPAESAIVTLTLSVTPLNEAICPVVYDQKLLNVHPLIITTTTLEDVLCYGAASGIVTATSADGTAPYNYFWSNGSNNQTVTGLVAGIYTLTVTDNLGCTATASVVVTQPETAVIATITDHTDPLCVAAATGSATVTASGGTPAVYPPLSPYTYLWSTGATTATITGLTAGTYEVTVTDGNGCQAATSIILTNPAGIEATISAIENVSCSGGNNGSATVTASGGLGSYTYLWNTVPAQTTSTATGLTAGQYMVTVTGTEGCSSFTMVTITEPTMLIAEIVNASNVSCNDMSNGSATVNATGGTSPYTYIWSASAGNQTTAIATGLPAGIHWVTVTDQNNCTAIVRVSISQPEVLQTGVTTLLNVICYNDPAGSVSANPVGGTAPYTYLWSTGSTDQTLYNLVAGTYAVTVYDMNGCMKTGSTAIVATDDVPAIIITPAPAFFNADPGQCSATGIVLPDPLVFDNCSDVTLSNNAPAVFPVGTTIVEWLAIDYNGNVSFANQSVTIFDVEAPHIICPQNIEQMGTSFISIPQPQVSDNCGIGSLINSFNGTSNASGIYPPGISEVIWTATDIHGNSSSCLMTVTINCEIDANNDTVTIPINAVTAVTVIDNDSACGAPINCNDITLLIMPNHMSVSVNPSNGNIICFPTPGFIGLDSLKYRVSCTAAAVNYNGNSDNLTLSAEAWVYIHVSPPPGGCLSGSTTICPGGNAIFLLSLTGTPPFTAVISDGTGETTYSGINSTIFPISVTPSLTTYYSLISVTDATSLTSTSNCTVLITVEEIQPYVVTGGGTNCAGSAGSIIGLSGSSTGVQYQLYRDNQPLSIIVSGTGSAISFGIQTQMGVYTVVATAGNCTRIMNGQATLNFYPLPEEYIVWGGGSCCFGCTDIHVYLNGSQQGCQYSLWLNDTTLVSQVNGSGTSIDFGYMTSAGTYTVTSTNNFGCTRTMYGEAVVIMHPKAGATLTSSTTTVCQGMLATLSIQFTSGTAPWSIEISDGTQTHSFGNIMMSSFTAYLAPTYTATYTISDVSDVNNCDGYGTGSATINVNSCENLSGRLTYANGEETPLDGITVKLVQNGTVMRTTTTNEEGQYAFISVNNGTYEIVPESDKPWGGGNSTDAMLIMKYFTGSSQLEGLKNEAARVNDTGAINSVDAMLVMRRFTQSLSSFNRGDWVFTTPEVVIDENLQVVDLQGLCVGDVNGSYTPPDGKTEPLVTIENSDVVYVSESREVIIPVRMRDRTKVGAVSLVVGYPSQSVDIIDVSMADGMGGKLTYNLLENELRIAWYSITGNALFSDETIILIRAKISDIQDLQTIAFEAMASSEIAGPSGYVSHVNLTMPVLKPASNDVTVVVQPNPFINNTTFILHTQDESEIDIRIYDIQGQELAKVNCPENLPAGDHSIEFDASALAQGMYQYRMIIKGRNTTTFKNGMLILKR